jgi:hypothetical protein
MVCCRVTFTFTFTFTSSPPICLRGADRGTVTCYLYLLPVTCYLYLYPPCARHVCGPIPNHIFASLTIGIKFYRTCFLSRWSWAQILAWRRAAFITCRYWQSVQKNVGTVRHITDRRWCSTSNCGQTSVQCVKLRTDVGAVRKITPRPFRPHHFLASSNRMTMNKQDSLVQN